MWVDGVQKVSWTNANVFGTATMTGALLKIGGVITALNSAPGQDVGQTRCAPFTLAACAGTVPGTGAPHAFNRYFDDIIVLKK